MTRELIVVLDGIEVETFWRVSRTIRKEGMHTLYTVTLILVGSDQWRVYSFYNLEHDVGKGYISSQTLGYLIQFTMSHGLTIEWKGGTNVVTCCKVDPVDETF